MIPRCWAQATPATATRPEWTASPSFGGLINYEAFIKALLRVGYDGYFVSEYCTPVLKNHTIAGIEAIDEGTRLSLRYMQRILTEVTGAAHEDRVRAAV